MRILITGSRNWTDRQALEDAIFEAIAEHYAEQGAVNSKDITIVHGAAPGADELAAGIADDWGFNHEPHPADWKKHFKAAGPLRNQEMVDLGADVCLAFPDEDSRGTLDCMARATVAGIDVRNKGAETERLLDALAERTLKFYWERCWDEEGC